MKSLPPNRFKYLLLGFALFFSIKISSQVNYIVRDTIATINIKLIDGGALNNALKCQVQEKDHVKIYTPHEVSEYGFKDERVYISREILIDGVPERVFLERIYQGDFNLYYFRGKGIKTFYLEGEDEGFLEIPKHDEIMGRNAFREILKDQMTDYNIDPDFFNNLSYRKSSIVRIINNRERDSYRNFISMNYGIIGGIGLLNYGPLENLFPQEMNDLTIKKNTAGILGMYIEQPLFHTLFSVYSGVNFSVAGVSYYQVLNDTATDLLVNSSWMSVPVFVRYNIPVRNNFFYVQTGGLFSRYFKHKRFIYNARHTTDGIYTTETDYSFSKRNHFGFVVSGGYKFNVLSNKKLSLEFRYMKDFKIGSDPVVKRDGLYFVTGFGF